MGMDQQTGLGLEPVWAGVLAVYEEFEKICHKHGLRFSVAGGTMLGAVRHQGFIPWDDDVDVIMPRRDYDKFCDIAKAELPPHLKLITPENTIEFSGHSFVKVQDTRKSAVEEIERKIGRRLSCGIFVDVFPYDGYPNSLIGRLWFKIQSVALKCRYRWVLGSFVEMRSLTSKFVFVIGALLKPFFPRLKSVLDFTRWQMTRAKKFPCETSEIVGWHDAHWYRPHEYAKRKYFDKLQLVPFCGRMVPVPSDPSDYLTALYGSDFMTPPPPEKRARPTHEETLDAPWKYGPTGC